MTSAGNNNTNKLQPITSKRKAIHFHTTSRHVFRPSNAKRNDSKCSIKSVVCFAHNNSYTRDETFNPEVTEVLFTLESRQIFNESMNMLNIDTDIAVTRSQQDKILIDFN
jgi:hypothetical protein